MGLSRFANVLDPRGGALAKMLPIYRAGLGGRLGGGDQAFPWVALDDVVGAIHQGLFDRTLVGPFNVVAPEAVTNAKFNEVLARTLGRPAVVPVPAFALKVAFGELATALLARAARAAGAAGARGVPVPAPDAGAGAGGDAGAVCGAGGGQRGTGRAGAVRSVVAMGAPMPLFGVNLPDTARLRLDAGAPELRLEELR